MSWFINCTFKLPFLMIDLIITLIRLLFLNLVLSNHHPFTTVAFSVKAQYIMQLLTLIYTKICVLCNIQRK